MNVGSFENPAPGMPPWTPVISKVESGHTGTKKTVSWQLLWSYSAQISIHTLFPVSHCDLYQEFNTRSGFSKLPKFFRICLSLEFRNALAKRRKFDFFSNVCCCCLTILRKVSSKKFPKFCLRICEN